MDSFGNAELVPIILSAAMVQAMISQPSKKYGAET